MLFVIAGFTRTFFPVDETRYVGVAWEMWLNHHWLLPTMNGALYSQKPPLLFWLIKLGWEMFGVNAVWPRVVVAAFAVGNLLMTHVLARTLWPDKPDVARMAPWILLGMVVWSAYSTMLMFDMLLCFFILVSLTALLHAARGRHAAWCLYAVALGLGLLTKGPVVFVFTLPAALAVRLWVVKHSLNLKQWFAFCVLAVLLGVLMILAWVVPAALIGGDAFSTNLIWTQTIHRIAHVFAHRHPFWWYVPFLLLMMMPWVVWPRCLKALGAFRWRSADAGLRFLLVVFLPAFVIMSAIHSKQLHYLLPFLPCFALFLSRQLCVYEKSILRLSLLAVAGLMLVMVLVVRPISRAHSLSAFAQKLAMIQKRHEPIAFIGNGSAPTYQDQFQFYGRLKQPLLNIRASQRAAFVKAHPNGWVIDFGKTRDVKGQQPVMTARYLQDGKFVRLWRAPRSG